jgi:hypothetical protein
MSWLGPLLSFGASLIQGRQKQKNYENRISDTVRQAKEAGIHPLEAIRGGLAQQQRPPLMTQTAMTNAFDKVEDILTGRSAAEQKSLELRNDLMRIQIDEARRGRTAGSAFIPNEYPTADPIQGVPPVDPIITTALRAIGAPQVGLSYNEDGEIVSDRVESPTQTYVGEQGNTVKVTEGPDADSMITGFAIRKILEFEKANEDNRISNWWRNALTFSEERPPDYGELAPDGSYYDRRPLPQTSLPPLGTLNWWK